VHSQDEAGVDEDSSFFLEHPIEDGIESIDDIREFPSLIFLAGCYRFACFNLQDFIIRQSVSLDCGRRLVSAR